MLNMAWIRLLLMTVALCSELMIRHADAQGEICRVSTGGRGICQQIRFCPSLRALLHQVRNTQQADAREVLRKAVCKFLGPEPLVCCPQENENPPPPQLSNEGNNSSDNSLLPSDCGINSVTDKIIDGEDAALGAWPWMVAFRGTSGSKSSWFCGGSLINKRYVLTAAHCFRESLRIRLEFARIGELNFKTSPDCIIQNNNRVCAPKPQDIPHEEIIMNPDYNNGCSQCNDIALVRLQRDVVMDPIYVRPICLPVDPLKDMGFPMSEWNTKFGTAAGWGSTARDKDTFIQPDILQQVKLPLRELNYCQQLKRNYFERESVICAGGLGQDTCRADSGGPLTLGNQFDTRRYLIGVTSLGPVICGSPNTQGLYTSVHFYIPWILSNIRP